MIKYILPILFFIPFTSTFADSNHEKSETEQIIEYITTLYSYGDIVVIKDLTTVINKKNINFHFFRFSKFNNYVTCENIKGTLSYHNRKLDNQNFVQVDRVESQSKPCKE